MENQELSEKQDPLKENTHIYNDNEICEVCKTTEKEIRARNYYDKLMYICVDCHYSYRREVVYGGKKIHKLKLENFKILKGKENGFEAVKNYNGENIYLWGSCGSGKSHLAAAIINITNPFDIIYTTPAMLNRNMRGLEPDEERRNLKYYIDMDYLIIDEFGFKQDSEFSRQIIYEIIEGRDKKEKQGMVITSNLNLNDLSQLYQDDRISSRIAGNFKVIEVSGKDMRIKGKIND